MPPSIYSHQLRHQEVINNRLNKVSKKAVMSKDKEAMKENDILEKLKDEDEIVRKVLEYR